MATYSGSDKRIKYLFENGGGGGSSSLAGLSDVNLSSPTDGQVLTYDNGEWVNAAGGSGGGSLGTGWILYKTQTGSVAVDISEIYDKATEFYVVAKASGSNSDTLNSLITRNAIENGLDRLGLGGDPNIALIEVSNTAFQLTYMKWGSVVTDNSVLEIYYKMAEAVVAPIIYSQEEREVGVWEDGKPLYQKTIAFSTAISGVQTINHGISNLDTVVEVTGAVHDGHETEPSWIPDPRIAQDGNNIGVSNVYPTFITIYVPTVFGSRIHKGHITIQYTKTTDTAGSGSWTPSGAPAVHYSTNEQVVGTWVDGKTIYQKTYAGLSLSCPMANTWYNTNIAFGDIDIITRAEIIDVNGQFIAGTVGNMSNRTYLGINLQISDRTISIITIQYTKTS